LFMSLVLVTSHSASIGSLLASSTRDYLESGAKPSGYRLTCKERSAHQIDAFRTG